MESPELSARLRYLKDSAQLLMRSAPATSRHLMSRCNSLMFDVGLEQSESQRRQICGGCGTVMVIGWEARLHFHTQQRRRRAGKVRNEPSNQIKEMAYSCESCGRTTRFQVPTPSARRKQLLEAGSKIQVPLLRKPESRPITAAANSNSKKRAKARKGGLEALLATKKASEAQQSGFGLDLMDFMKKS
jgi:RNase P subunit RPR2